VVGRRAVGLPAEGVITAQPLGVGNNLALGLAPFNHEFGSVDEVPVIESFLELGGSLQIDRIHDPAAGTGSIDNIRRLDRYPLPEPTSGYVDIPTPIGSVSLRSARHIHQVLDVPERLTFALHVGRKRNGDLVYYA
jgi:hypothetical protein